MYLFFTVFTDAGFQRELPDFAGGTGVADPTTGQTSESCATVTPLAAGPLRQPVGRSLCKSLPPLIHQFLSLSQHSIRLFFHVLHLD